MEIKTVIWMVSALVLAGGPGFAESADEPLTQANQQTIHSEPMSGNYQRYGRQGTPMAQSPPTGWKDLSGKVQSFDRTSQTLQLRDKFGNLFIIPIDSQVSIHRGKKAVGFSELHRGDSVHLHMTRAK